MTQTNAHHSVKRREMRSIPEQQSDEKVKRKETLGKGKLIWITLFVKSDSHATNVDNNKLLWEDIEFQRTRR